MKNSIYLYSQLAKLLVLLLFFGSATDVAATNQPLTFIKNQGQIIDQSGNSRSDIKYYIQGHSMTAYFLPDRISYVFRERMPRDPYFKHPDWGNNIHQRIQDEDTLQGYRMDAVFLNSNQSIQFIEEDSSSHYYNFYLGHLSAGLTQVRGYKKITYSNIYNSIDLVVYTNGTSLKYDFIVHPGGNPQNISIDYSTASNISILNNGSLLATTPLGNVTDAAPVAYLNENNASVSCSYQLGNDVISFNTGSYDTTKTLVIDPVIAWATYLGGDPEDEAFSMTVDIQNSVIITGETYNTSFPITPGMFSYQGGDNDVFAAKFDVNGNLVYATYFGGSDGELYCFVEASKSTADIYITGGTLSLNIPGTAGQYQPVHGGQVDIFLAKFNASGFLQWSTYYGNTGDDQGWDIATDNANNVIICGIGSGLSGTAGAFQPNGAGAFASKWTSAGNLVRTTYFSGSNGPNWVDGGTWAFGVITNAGNDIFITGGTFNQFLPNTVGTQLSNSHQPSTYGAEAYIARFNSALTLNLGSRFYGGNNDQETGMDLAADANGNISVSGYAYMRLALPLTGGLPVSASAIQSNVAGGYSDAFAARFSPNLAIMQWGTYYGTPDADYGNGVTTDQNGIVYCTGMVRLTGIAMSVPCSYQPVSNSGDESFILQVNPNGTMNYATYYGGIGGESAYDIRVDGNSDIVIAGYTTSPNLSGTANGWQNYLNGDFDAFVTKFTPCKVSITATATTFCAGQTSTLSAGAGFSAYLWSTGASTQTITVTQSGTYTVIVTDASGCKCSNSINITVNPTPNITITGPTSTCGGAGQNYSVPFQPNTTYTWSISPSINITPVNNMMTVNFTQGITQSYWVKVTATTSAGCVAKDSIYVGACCYVEYPANPASPSFYNNSSSQVAGMTSTGWITVTGTQYLIENKFFAINGTFTVQGTTIFSDCDIKLGYNARIIISPGDTLIITDKNGLTSRLWACYDMWDGIYVDGTNSQSFLRINNGTSIEDGMNAIHSNNGGKFEIYGGSAGNVKLNKNFKHVVVKNKASGAHPGFIQATDISCKDNITGVTFPSSTAHTLRPPMNGKRTHIGVEITDVFLFDKMGNAAVTGYRNTFDNMDYGVKSLNSSVTIKNNEFKNITGSSLILKKDECPIGTAICSRGNVNMFVPRTIIAGGSSANEPNNIHDGHTGMDAASHLNITVRYNTFKNLRTGVVSRKSYLKTNTVDYNSFKDMTTGIDMLDLRNSTVNIRNNTMNLKNINNTTGINVAEVIIPSLTRYTITDNVIDTVRNGITAKLIYKAKIDRNTVRLKHTSSAASYGRGVFVASSNSSWVRSNNIYGQNRNDYWMEGVRLDICHTDTILCNLTRNLGSGQFYSGPQPSTLFAKNTMDDNLRGLVLNGGGVIGSQGTITNPNDNRWIGTFTSGAKTHAYNSSGAMSPFIVQNTTQHYPTTSTNTSAPLANAFIVFTNNATVSSSVSCSVANPHDAYAALPMALKIAGDSITYPVNDTANKWLQSWALYSFLKEDATLLSDTLVNSFFAHHDSTAIGLLYSVQQIMSDTAISAGELDSARTVNRSFVAANDIESYWQAINDILILNQVDSLIPEGEQLEVIRTIAEKCPFTGGPAVYIARALAAAYDPTYTEYEDECEHAEPERERERLAAPDSQTQPAGYKLYPNPNDGNMQLSYGLAEGQTGEMLIYDLAGRKVAAYELKAGEQILLINKTGLDNGVYLYRIIVDGKIAKADKLVIVK